MNEKLLKLLSKKKIYFGNIYCCERLYPEKNKLVKGPVALLKLSSNYYYVLEDECGYWDHAIENEEYYVSDITPELNTNKNKFQVRMLKK